MSRTHRTIVTVICLVLVPVAFWPLLDLTVTSNAAAQSGPPATAQTIKKSDLFEELGRSRIEAILAEPVPAIEIKQKPLREVLVELQKLTGINMYFAPQEVGDVIDPDVPITVDVAENAMTYQTLIREFILAPKSLDFVIRNNFLVVMSYELRLASADAANLVIYNCRDLLVGIPVQPAHAVPGVSGGEQVESPDGEIAAPEETRPASQTENLHQFGMGGGGFGGEGLGQGASALKSVEEAFSDIGAREQQLVELIRATTGHEDFPWADENNINFQYGGTVQAFNGLLVVRTLPEVHEQVRQLLRMLRESTKEQDWPAELGDWPHRKKIAPPPGGGQPQPAGGNFF